MGSTGVLAGVGWTALMVAAGRAVETAQPDPLVHDPFAAKVVAASGAQPPLPVEPGAGWPTASGVADPELDGFWEMMATYQGVRSKVFDDALRAAAGRGIDQIVILAAGLDARAYRLDWPAGTRIFEIDTADVLAAKDELFGAEPTTDRTPVAVDLRDDWPAALTTAGLDPDRPSAWLAEGLLPFLPAAAQESLFARIAGLATTGSTIAVEHFSSAMDVLANMELLGRLARPWGIDVEGLLQDDQHERPHPAERLGADGWRPEIVRAADVAAAHGRSLALANGSALLDTELITAVRG